MCTSEVLQQVRFLQHTAHYPLICAVRAAHSCGLPYSRALHFCSQGATAGPAAIESYRLRHGITAPAFYFRHCLFVKQVSLGRELAVPAMNNCCTAHVQLILSLRCNSIFMSVFCCTLNLLNTVALDLLQLTAGNWSPPERNTAAVVMACLIMSCIESSV